MENFEVRTPHIKARLKSDIAKIIVMPGGVIRARNFAEKYLKNIVTFNGTRGCIGYTGIYKGQKISVHPSGMGFGSAGIYYYEFYKFCEVEMIIRMGSCGGYNKEIVTEDVVIGKKFYSESNFSKTFSQVEQNVIEEDTEIVKEALDVSKMLKFKVKAVFIHSTNVFYNQKEKAWEDIHANGNNVDVVEMEGFALRVIGNFLNKKSLTVCVVTDHLVHKNSLPSEARERSLGHLFHYTIELAHHFAKKY